MKTYYAILKFDFGVNTIEIVSEPFDKENLEDLKKELDTHLKQVVTGELTYLEAYCESKQRKYFFPKDVLLKCVISYTIEEK